MVVVLDRETLESPLVDVPRANGTIMGVQPHRVRQGDPAEEVAHAAVLGRPEHEVPMIWHQLVGQNLTRIPLHAFGNDAFEGVKIRRLPKNLGAGVAAVECVVDSARLIGAFRPSHSDSMSGE